MPWSSRSLVAVLLWLVVGAPGTAAAASDGLLTGELGRWIDESVAPELAETLSRHPRFDGQTVRLVTLVSGAPAGAGNALGRAVERRLRQRLLAVDGVRLAADAPRSGCRAPRPVDYLVRLELSPDGGRSARLNVAVVDVAEAVWVSGISYQWQGRLSAAERRAMRQPVSATNAGSAGSPIPVGDAEAVATALEAELTCLLPRDLSGALFVEVPDDDALAGVALALKRKLMVAPLAAITADRGQADWLLSVEGEPGSADPRELGLVLRNATGAQPQRVAAVFVAGMAADERLAARAPTPAGPAVDPEPRTPRPRPSADVAAPAPPYSSDAASLELLSTLRLEPAAREGICDSRRARVNSCVEIGFEVHRPAFLLVLSTQDHRVVDAPCAAPERSASGSRRFRVRLPPGSYAVDQADTGPDAGFYVLATTNRRVAERLQQALATAPGQCGTADGDTGRWLAGLAAQLERHASDVSWRAVHLVHGHAGIAAL
jgi:hypothetical protein